MLASKPPLPKLLELHEQATAGGGAGLPSRREMVAAVSAAHAAVETARSSLAQAHERWVGVEGAVVSALRKTDLGDTQRSIEALAQQRRGVWGVCASQLATLLSVSAGVRGQEAHSSVLTSSHAAIDNAHLALMGRLQATLLADSAAGAEIRQGASYLAYAAEEKARLEEALEQNGAALLSVEAQLAKVRVKVVPQVHTARRVAAEISGQVSAALQLGKDVGSLLRNLIITTRHDPPVARAAAALDAQHKSAQTLLKDVAHGIITALEAPNVPERKSEGEAAALAVVRQFVNNWSRPALKAGFADIARHATEFHVKLVEFGARCATQAQKGGEEEDGAAGIEAEAADGDIDADAETAAITEEADGEATGVGGKTGNPSPPPGQDAGGGEEVVAEMRDRYALGALKRVRYKLDGRDACRLQSLHSEGGGAEPARPLERGSGLSVADHVERVIQEATSLDNLASMYEGWTPWI